MEEDKKKVTLRYINFQLSFLFLMIPSISPHAQADDTLEVLQQAAQTAALCVLHITTKILKYALSSQFYPFFMIIQHLFTIAQQQVVNTQANLCKAIHVAWYFRFHSLAKYKVVMF